MTGQPRGSLAGTWKLVSYETCRAGKKVRHPFGARPRGYLTYTPDGFMSVAIMPQRRAPPTSARANVDPFRLRTWLSWRGLRRLARYVLTATVYISYSGRYTIAGETVIHHVEVSNMPGLIRTDQVRTYALQGHRLVLSADIAGVRQVFAF